MYADSVYLAYKKFNIGKKPLSTGAKPRLTVIFEGRQFPKKRHGYITRVTSVVNEM